MGSFVQPGTLPFGNGFGARASAFAQGLSNIASLWDNSDKKDNHFWHNDTIRIPNIDSLKRGVLYDQDTVVSHDLYDYGRQPARDSALNRNLRWIKNLK